MKSNWLYISLEDVLHLHQKQLARFGGAHGIRDRGLLISALAQAELHLFGDHVYKHAYEIAAVYAYHLIKNHPFIDGNKRIGIFVALTFLAINGLLIDTDDDELYNLAMDIAASKIDKDAVMNFFKERVS